MSTLRHLLAFLRTRLWPDDAEPSDTPGPATFADRRLGGRRAR